MPGRSRRARALAWVAALAAALAALWALSGRAPDGPPGGPPLDHIDAESRAEVERLLRDADRTEPPQR